ncbi:MAG: glycosyltransferase [Candidatus Bathyarchaeia archaeon]
MTHEFVELGHDVTVFRKEGYKFDVVCVHNWLSSIAGLITKNETKIPVIFHVHSTEWGRSGGKAQRLFHILNGQLPKLLTE